MNKTDTVWTVLVWLSSWLNHLKNVDCWSAHCYTLADGKISECLVRLELTVWEIWQFCQGGFPPPPPPIDSLQNSPPQLNIKEGHLAFVNMCNGPCSNVQCTYLVRNLIADCEPYVLVFRAFGLYSMKICWFSPEVFTIACHFVHKATPPDPCPLWYAEFYLGRTTQKMQWIWWTILAVLPQRRAAPRPGPRCCPTRWFGWSMVRQLGGGSLLGSELPFKVKYSL